jgi:branched-chain amino acid aminotransferase
MTNNLPQYIWMNGQFILQQDANISVLTHSLHYGGSVFEGIRARASRTFKLKEHIKRLINSADLMHLNVSYTEEELIHATEELLKKNNLSDAYIRPIIWRRANDLKLDSKCEVDVAIIANSSKVPLIADSHLIISKWQKTPPSVAPVQSKSSIFYAMMRIAKEEAVVQGFDDALILDYENYIAECTTTNIFFAKGNSLFTPIADRFLNGITRQTVIEIAHNLGISAREIRINIEDLSQYDACFSTGTAVGIKNISSITSKQQKYVFNNNKIADLIRSEYNKLIEKEDV